MFSAALGGIPIQGTRTHVLRNNTYIISLSNDYHRSIKVSKAQQSIRDRQRISKSFESNATRDLVQYYMDEIDNVSSKYENIGLTNISPILHKGTMYSTSELYMYVTLLIAIYLKVLQTFVHLRMTNIRSHEIDNEIDNEIKYCYDRLEGLLRSVDYSVAPNVLSTAAALNCMSIRSQIDEAVDAYGADVPLTMQCTHNITTLVLLFAHAKHYSRDLPSYPASDKDVINKVVDSLYDFRIGDTPRSMFAVRHYIDTLEQQRKDDKWHYDKFAGAALELALDNNSQDAVNLYHHTQAGGSVAFLPYALVRQSSTDSLTSMEEFFSGIIPADIVNPRPANTPSQTHTPYFQPSIPPRDSVDYPPQPIPIDPQDLHDYQIPLYDNIVNPPPANIVNPPPANIVNPPPANIVNPFSETELYDRYGNNEGHFDGMYAYM
ncbi:hypothetical protein EPVG_00360 [Emiliania huxleyi virus 201]|nr:hypothetical protein ELVG_00393 [Emiliania huxleyi virus 203]AEP15721.1 hypothetical protein EQVG_00311 [Emiliania huxleyi virus 207]AEP16213.1 hypothetical protein ERVG_00338 [Emiliania huxleyi virus 208]AET98247.1 hypothetical protein EPVG_00360 [Emiliania huxleyi virus 201]